MAKDHRHILDTRIGPDRDVRARRELAYVEQVKLFATWLNGVAIATFAVGGIAPTVATISSDAGKFNFTLASLVLGSILVSMVLHLMARKILRRLE